MSVARDPASETPLAHGDRLRFAEFERYRLLAGRPIPAHDTQPIAGWQLVQATSNRTQGERLARLAAWVGRRAGRPIRTLELGTSVGISGTYLLTGMAEAQGGHLATFEGRSHIAASAQHRLETFVGRFGLASVVTFEIVVGPFTDTYESYLRASPRPLLDLVFIDGHHQAEPTLRYHACLQGRLAPGAVVVHDDISWSSDMARAWAVICDQERRHLLVEHWQGGRPSRGIIYYGEPGVSQPLRIDIDRTPARLAKSLWRVVSRFKP